MTPAPSARSGRSRRTDGPARRHDSRARRPGRAPASTWRRWPTRVGTGARSDRPRVPRDRRPGHAPVERPAATAPRTATTTSSVAGPPADRRPDALRRPRTSRPGRARPAEAARARHRHRRTATRSARSTPRSTSPTRSSRPGRPWSSARSSWPSAGSPRSRSPATGCSPSRPCPTSTGDRFVDAAAYTETNAAFHDYLFTLTGNEHLLQAYQALGVKGHMEEVLRTATWCDPRCAQDHLDIVDAIEARRPPGRPHADRRPRRAVEGDHAAGDGRRGAPRAGRGSSPRAGSPARSSWSPGRPRASASAPPAGSPPRAALVVLADRAETRQASWPTSWPAQRRGRPSPVVADLETWEGAEAVVERGDLERSAGSTCRSTPSAARSGPSPSTIPAERDPGRDQPLADARRCGPAARSRRAWSSAAQAPSSTSRRSRPAASTGSRTPRRRAGSTRSPRRWPSSWRRTASGSSPPPRRHRRPAAPDPRGARTAGATRSRSGTRPSSTRRSSPR